MSPKSIHLPARPHWRLLTASRSTRLLRNIYVHCFARCTNCVLFNRSHRFRPEQFRHVGRIDDDAKMRRVETVKPRVSFADLQRMPDDGNRYELYDGELHVVPAPMPRHQRVARRLFEWLLEYARHAGGETFFAPLDLVVTDYDVVQPDLMYFGPASAPRINPDEAIRFLPDLAIEVLSPSTARIDRGRKQSLFEHAGLPEYWIVDPAASGMDVFVLRQGRYEEPVRPTGSFTSPTVPGLAVNLAELFRD
jgi:Uma2 family endonuclease